MTEYEYKVKSELMRIGKNQKWLVEEIPKYYKGYCDAALVSKSITGKHGGTNKVRHAINVAIKHELLTQISKGETQNEI